MAPAKRRENWSSGVTVPGATMNILFIGGLPSGADEDTYHNNDADMGIVNARRGNFNVSQVYYNRDRTQWYEPQQNHGDGPQKIVPVEDVKAFIEEKKPDVVVFSNTDLDGHKDFRPESRDPVIATLFDFARQTGPDGQPNAPYIIIHEPVSQGMQVEAKGAGHETAGKHSTLARNAAILGKTGARVDIVTRPEEDVKYVSRLIQDFAGHKAAGLAGPTAV